jgi:hypothetical protein
MTAGSLEYAMEPAASEPNWAMLLAGVREPPKIF